MVRESESVGEPEEEPKNQFFKNFMAILFGVKKIRDCKIFFEISENFVPMGNFCRKPFRVLKISNFQTPFLSRSMRL